MLNGKKLTDLIKSKHNSNHKTQQMTLKGEIVQEYIYYVLGFVPAEVVRLKNDVWFNRLENEQMKSVGKFLESKKPFNDLILAPNPNAESELEMLSNSTLYYFILRQ